MQGKLEMVFCLQNCSDLLWEKIVLVIKKNVRGRRPRICKIFEITTTIYWSSEISEYFLKQNAFKTYYWRFIISNALEQLEFNFEKLIGIKLENLDCHHFFYFSVINCCTLFCFYNREGVFDYCWGPSIVTACRHMEMMLGAFHKLRHNFHYTNPQGGPGGEGSKIKE